MPDPIEARCAAFLALSLPPTESLARLQPLLDDLNAEIQRLARLQDRDLEVFLHNQGESKADTFESIALHERGEALNELLRALTELRAVWREKLEEN